MNQSLRGAKLSAAVILIKVEDTIVMMPRFKWRSSRIVDGTGMVYAACICQRARRGSGCVNEIWWVVQTRCWSCVWLEESTSSKYARHHMRIVLQSGQAGRWCWSVCSVVCVVMLKQCVYMKEAQ